MGHKLQAGCVPAGRPEQDIGPNHRLPRDGSQAHLLAAGGLLGALLASTCCIAPLLLVMLGVSGAWIGTLTLLEQFKWYFLCATALLLGAGFWHVYFRKPKECTQGSFCAHRASGTITRLILWSGTVLTVLSASIDYWGPLFY